MRHTVHMMLGGETGGFLRDLKQYVIKYGAADLQGFFNAIHYEENGAESFFSTAVPKKADDSQFISGIDNLYEVEYAAPFKVPATGRMEYLQSFFTGLYNGRITINNPGDSVRMHLCIYLPLYDRRKWDLVREFIDAIEGIPQKYRVDLFLLPYDLAFLFEEDRDTLPERMAAYRKTTSEVLGEILEYRKTSKTLNQLTMLQDCNAQGVALGLDRDSFVRIIGEYALLCVENYQSVYPGTAHDESRPITALGISVLSFDKYYFVQYLLHKAYTQILDRENVCQDEVEVNKVSVVVQDILSRNEKLFSDIYDREVRTRLDRNIPQTQIVAEVAPILDKEIKRLTKEFQGYLSDQTLSLPEKKATLAQLLGEDDELLQGYMFNKKQLVLDDCSREVLGFFTAANNELAGCHPTEESPSVVKDIHNSAILGDKEGDPVENAGDTLDNLKDIRVKIRESSNYIRKKTRELEDLQVQQTQTEVSDKRLTDEGFVFGGNTYKLTDGTEETSLGEQYTPSGRPISSNIDLSKSFTAVKNQGEKGACSAFALVSILEYILKKNSKTEPDLSEEFVYYNVRKQKGKVGEDPGSSLMDVLKTLSEDGVCHEKFCKYEENDLATEPSAEAYEDARKLRVVKALDVDAKDIRSAISEGYPVAISLNVFDSFTPVEGFVPMPTAEDITGLKGSHAMVIVGYDDETRFYRVRNSWGRSFGDKGYCYIPYSYIENKAFLNGACIITEINDTKLIVRGSDSLATISFDTENAKILSMILTNRIQDEKKALAGHIKEFSEVSTRFNTIYQKLCIQNTRDTICEGKKLKLGHEAEQLAVEKERTFNERTSSLKAFDKRTNKIRLYYWLSIAGIVLSYVLAVVLEWKISKHDLASTMSVFTNWFSYTIYILYAIWTILFILWMRKRKHDRTDMDERYKSKLKELSVEIEGKKRESGIIQLKSHLAGMIIDSLSKISKNLYEKYNGMRSYIGNLRVWRNMEAESSRNMVPLDRDPFLTLVSNECLDRYFETKKDDLIKGIDLSKMFHDKYRVSEEDIVRFKYSLKDKVIEELYKEVDGFSLLKHIMRKQAYPYVSHEYMDIDALMQQMDIKSNPFVRLRPQAASRDADNTHCKMAFIHMDDNNDRLNWENASRENFSMPPMLYPSDSPFKLTLLQMKGLSASDISILDN